ncbi:MAG: alpha/beta hydrolase [Desulfobacterales bacterium]|nr:alpha/beta hydrolase [Desulfobacterales bacterium]
MLSISLVISCALPATETGHIDQRRIEFAQLGQGSPVVVFKNGLGAPMPGWNKVFAEIGRQATVFAYHRPGYGRSDPAETPRDDAHIVDELRALHRRRGLAPPYVLVGHSLGGLYMQLYARKYPDEVAGLVLVDSTHPSQMEGAGRIEPAVVVRTLFHLWATGERRREFDAAPATGQEVLRLPAVTGKPVWVLVLIDNSQAEAVQRANRKRADLARLYPGSQVQWVKSGHFIE